MSFIDQTLGLWVGVTLTDGWMGGWVDGWTDMWTEGQICGRMDGLAVRCVSNSAYVII
jgi:hypothetical protein